jgi:hypothetical protein
VAGAAAGTVGTPLTGWKTQPAPCESAGGVDATDGPWELSGVGTVAVARENQVTTLNRLRDHWIEQSYEITEFHTVPAGDTGGRVSARIPASGLSITAQSTVPRTGMAIIVDTPCYQPAEGEDPANAVF